MSRIAADKKSTTEKGSVRSFARKSDFKKFYNEDGRSHHGHERYADGATRDGGSIYSAQLHGHNAVYENTYRMEPEASSRFDEYKIDKLVENLLEQELKDSVYSPEASQKCALALASKIMEKVKETKLKRYKLVVVVNIGDCKEKPSVHYFSRCLWNKSSDSFSSVHYSNQSLYATVLVFGVYYE